MCSFSTLMNLANRLNGYPYVLPKNLNVFLSNCNRISKSIKSFIIYRKNFNITSNTCFIYIYTSIRYHAQIVTTYQIRVKAEVEDKSSVNKQNGVAASSCTVFRTVFFRRGGHISTRGNVKRRFQRAN